MAGTPFIQTRNIIKRYGTLTAVDDLSLEVYAGEVFGLLGPNGAGKTTSINMCCGLLRPDSGRVLIHGKAITNGDSTLRARVGVCPQTITLWNNLSCLEQMQYVGELYGLRPKYARERSLQLLSDLDLDEKKKSLARNLSGGMQRRLNLALALVHDPELLVLDEPEAGLDPQSRVLVREYIKSLAHRKTIIFTTHNMDEAERVADRVAIIDHGRLLVVDSPEQLKRQVGEGDVLELELTADVEKAVQSLKPLVSQVSTSNNTVSLRARGMIERLPAILESLRRVDAYPVEVRLRPTSLEDVFISLTGRRLRE